MNSQLYAHLEAYNDNDVNQDCNGGGDEASPSGSNGDKKGDRNDSNIASVIPACKNDPKDADHKSFGQDIGGMWRLALIPVGLAVLVASDEARIVMLTLTCLIIWQHQKDTDVTGTQSLWFRQGHRNHPREQLAYETSKGNTEHELSMRNLYECRKEASRLLGLIGAPPMGGFEPTEKNGERQFYPQNQIIGIGDNDSNLSFCQNSSKEDGNKPLLRMFEIDTVDSRATNSVVRFLEAHSQLVLTIDKALYWLKISSGLHWGLGAHSQSVERVERAAMSRAFRVATREAVKEKDNPSKHSDNALANGSTSSKSMISAATAIATKTTNVAVPTTSPSVSGKHERKGQPQRKVDTSSILALASTRRNIAQVIVHEAQSIVDVFVAVEDDLARRRQKRRREDKTRSDGEIVDDCGVETNSVNHEEDHDSVVKYGTLTMPEVIDLVWIKKSRKHIAILLTDCAEKFCGWSALGALSSVASDETQTISTLQSRSYDLLNESTRTAMNLREYLASNLLLDESSTSSSSTLSSTSVFPISSRTTENNYCEFVLPLLRYRQQLDALDAALWSFQMHTHNHQCAINTLDAPSEAASSVNESDPTLTRQNPSHFDEDDPNIDSMIITSRLAWWKQVKQLSATCQTLEYQIESRLFPLTEHDENQNASEGDSGSNSNNLSKININNANEAQSYEHGNDKELPDPDQRKAKSTKTLVFSGEGAKKKQSAKKARKNSRVDGETSNPLGKSSSSTMYMPAARDPFSEQLLVRELQNRIEAVAALREEYPQEDSSSVGSTREPLEEYEGKESPKNTPSTNPKMNNVTKRKTEVATSIFLGASGSLLDELKMTIGPTLQADENSEDNMVGVYAGIDTFTGAEKSCDLAPEE